MSTYAAIFVKDQKSGRYNGISVKYDGYIKDGVGETLYRFWNDPNDVKKLCEGKKSDMRTLGKTIDQSEWFKDEIFDRYKTFKNLTFQEMISNSANISYNFSYVFEKFIDTFKWFIIKRDPANLELLEDFFPEN